MPDVRAALRLIDEFLWVLRRGGLVVATSQAIDAVRAAREVGFASPATLREAVASVVVTRAVDRAGYDEAFDAFFAASAVPRTLWERLAASGFTDAEREALRELLDAHAAAPEGAALSALLQGGSELDALLRSSGALRLLDAVQSPLQAGFFAQRLGRAVGLPEAFAGLALVRSALIDAVGEERADALTTALRKELDRARVDVRRRVDDVLARREAQGRVSTDLLEKPLGTLDPEESRAVRDALRRFVHNLRGGERVRRKRAKHGRIDAHRTLRRAMRTGGVPFALVRKARRRDKPRLVIVCDVSDSVREVSRFALELTYAAQELFAGTRSFVFVSELGETTELFARAPAETALALAYQGAVIPVTHNSNYGRMLRSFERDVLEDVDRRTTVLIVGDGRTNFQAPGDEVLEAIRQRARALVWLCPEPRASWSTGDSMMARYAPKCTKTLEVRTARDLEDAARLVLSLR